MFINFYYHLKSEGVPVSLNEWMTLIEALAKGLAFSSLTGFYYLARAVLVKNEAHLDRYDVAFAKYFNGIEPQPSLLEQVLDWLANPMSPMGADKRSLFADWDLEELKRQVEERLKTQDGEHHGGSRWIGTGGYTAFGHSGTNPSGVRIGGESNNMSAVKVAANRNYKEFRNDQITGVRQFEVALKKLRQFSTKLEGPKDELDIDATIDATSKNAGLLKLIWDRPRHNTMKLAILMDSGGSMSQYVRICSRLFTAANSATHFKDMRFYYFHNCVYDRLYTTATLRKWESTESVLNNLASDYRLIIIGDASMAPSELTMYGGAIDWDVEDNKPGLYWLKLLYDHFPYSVWLNPIPLPYWDRTLGYYTIDLVRKVFPMFQLSPEGLEQAVKKLKTINK